MTEHLPKAAVIRSPPARAGGALLLLTGLTLLLETYLWWGKFQYHHLLYQVTTILFIVLGVLLSHWCFGDSRARLGIRIDNRKQVIQVYGIPTLLIGAAIILAGAWFGEFHPVTPVGVVSYLAWATVQQHVLQNFYRLRLQELTSQVFPSRALSTSLAVLAAAGLFAILHWPNPVLTALTFLGGLLWCRLYLKTPSLWGAAFSQTVLTVCLMLFFKFGPLNHFEVGAPGKRFEFYGQGIRLAAGYGPGAEPVIGTLPGPDRGHPSQVRLFGPEGRLLREWVAFPGYDFSGEVAIGDLLPGPGDEVAVTLGPGYDNPPLLRIFDFYGTLIREIRLPNLPAHYGAWVSIACGRLYAGAGPGPESPQRLLELNAGGTVLREWSFDIPLENGLRGTAICPPEPDRDPVQIMVWGTDISTNPSTLFFLDTGTREVRPVTTMGTTFGVQASLVRQSGRPPRVVVAPGPLRGHIGVVQLQDLSGERVRHITFDEDPARFGASVAAVDVDGDGDEEIVVGEGVGPGRGFQVQILSRDGAVLGGWQAYSRSGSRASFF